MSSPMKRYSSPTHSSFAKTMPPVHLREKLQTLTTDVEALREDFAQGLAVTESLEKTSVKQYDVLSGQVTSLKTAFLDLSEAVIGQLDQIKSELLDTVDRKISALSPRVDSLFASVSRNLDDYTSIEGRMFAYQQDTEQQFIDIGQRQLALNKEISALRGQLATNNERIDRLSQELKVNKVENEKSFTRLTEMHLATVRDCDKLSREIEAMDGEIRGAVRSSHESLAGRLRELLTETEERLCEVDSCVKTLSAEGEKNAENNLNQSKQLLYLEEELKELSKRSSSDFQDQRSKLATLSRAVDLNVAQMVDSLTKRLGDAERLSEQARAQTNSSLSAIQQSVAYKQESVSRAIQSLARQLNIPNPLLTN